MTILAVDDKLENLKVLIKYLEDSGFELMVAQRGEEALKHVERIIPDMILLDVLMPGIDDADDVDDSAQATKRPRRGV